MSTKALVWTVIIIVIVIVAGIFIFNSNQSSQVAPQTTPTGTDSPEVVNQEQDMNATDTSDMGTDTSDTSGADVTATATMPVGY